MIILMLALAAAFGAGYVCGRRWRGGEMTALRAQLDSLHDPELLRAAELRKQMQQDQRAFNLLCNYGTELAYGQVSAAELLNKEDRYAR